MIMINNNNNNNNNNMNTKVSEYKMIVGLCRGGGIGLNGTLPWPKLARDMRFFYETTRSIHFPNTNAVVMGRKTWDSIPDCSKPLKYRDNFVVSAHNYIMEKDEQAASTTDDLTQDNNHIPVVTYLKTVNDIMVHTTNYENVWIIGGASIYEQCIHNKALEITEIYISFIDEQYEFDTIFPIMYQYDSIDEILELNELNNHKQANNNKLNRRLWTWTDAESVPKFLSFDTVFPSFYYIEDIDRNIIADLTRESDIIATRDRRIPNIRFLKLKKLIFI